MRTTRFGHQKEEAHHERDEDEGCDRARPEGWEGRMALPMGRTTGDERRRRPPDGAETASGWTISASADWNTGEGDSIAQEPNFGDSVSRLPSRENMTPSWGVLRDYDAAVIFRG